MRVALNVEQLLTDAPGGIGRYTAELARRLPAAGVDVAPFVARHPRARVDAALAEAGIASATILGLPRPLLYDCWHVLGLGTPAARVGPVDLVHAPSLAVPPRGGRPLVVTAHDAATVTTPGTATRRGRWFHARGLAAAAQRADVVIAVSRFAADELAEHGTIPRDRLRVVPNGVDLGRATPEAIERVRHRLPDPRVPYVAWVGVAQPRKDLGTLLGAFHQLVSTRPALPHRLVVAGPPGWGVSAIDAWRERLGTRLVELGPLPGDHVAALLAGAEVLALPSTHEGFGLPVLEAMAQGTAVLCSDLPALREIAADVAVLVAPGETDRWCGALEQLIDDPAERERRGALGLERAAAYSWTRCVEATVAVYREVLGT